jgi:uncharacterized protein
MKTQLVKKSAQTTARWAGGTTTQLAIFPEGAEYTKFNFIFRMSTATVEVEKSTFTFMPGVTRHLMILEGSLKIDHTDRYKKTMEKYGADVFDGEWPTTAEGKVTDFNLMVREGAEGKLEELFLAEEKSKEIVFDGEWDYFGFYPNAGSIKIDVGTEIFILHEKDFLWIACGDKNNSGKILVSADKRAHCIVARVKLP